MNTIHVDVVSAEESIFSGEARFVALPGESGELGIFPRHTPLITRIKPGSVRIEMADGSEEFVFVAGGILEVQPNCVTVLADHAIEIVADRALARTLPAQQWQTLISDMQAAFQGGHYAMGMTAALERVSLLLETNFPRDPLQPVHEGGDNLPDTVVIQRH